MPHWDKYLDELDEDNEVTTERFEKITKRKIDKSTFNGNDGVNPKQKEKRVDEKRKGKV